MSGPPPAPQRAPENGRPASWRRRSETSGRRSRRVWVALPVAKETGLDRASAATGVDQHGREVPVMHAADGHLPARAAGSAGAREAWSGTAGAVFQPAEIHRSEVSPCCCPRPVRKSATSPCRSRAAVAAGGRRAWFHGSGYASVKRVGAYSSTGMRRVARSLSWRWVKSASSAMTIRRPCADRWPGVEEECGAGAGAWQRPSAWRRRSPLRRRRTRGR